jgi:hypothetical protein
MTNADVTPFDASSVLDGLYDFQRATVEHAFARLYGAKDSTRRFLVADETGLGKTHIARGVIAKTIERLQHDDDVKRIDIVYVCSNGDIAEQNLRKLVIGGDGRPAPATRLTLLITQRDLLHSVADAGTKPTTFVAFTPGTSFELGWQTGKAEERAVLFELVASILDLDRAGSTAFKRIMQGGVASLDRFEVYRSHLLYRTGGEWEPQIERAFRRTLLSDRRLRRNVEELVDEVRYRSGLNQDQKDRARALTARLRDALARASVAALEPDLIILDEFQRFRDLLTGETQAGELAGHLFEQPDARVLLLSATPYKAFTYAEEADAGDDHYRDMFRTLEFLDNGQERVESLRSRLSELRRCVLAGDSVAAAKAELERELRRLMSRTERPPLGADGMLAEPSPTTLRLVEPEDLLDYAALDRVARAVEAPLSVEYWKSAPYFGNFLDGYKVGDKLKQALKDSKQADEVAALVRSLRTFRRSDVERYKAIEWGNARLRALADETVNAGWWRLLWIPPSMPYYEPGPPYDATGSRQVTKRLIFSSWVAAPTAIASLLSYEVERRIYQGADPTYDNTPKTRRSIVARLSFRMDGPRPASMSLLPLFWPSPALATALDPLLAARESPERLLPRDELLEWARRTAAQVVGPSGEGRSTASVAWHWAAPLLADGREPFAEGLRDLGADSLSEALVGSIDDPDAEASAVVASHVEGALEALGGQLPVSERPDDLVDVVAMAGLAAPGNVAWRALARVRDPKGTVTDTGLWVAATHLASGLRALFNRPEVTLLLDEIGENDGRQYAQVVLEYCLNGNLQAVLDEYVHHLAEAEGLDTTTDEGLLSLAQAVRRALTVRSARYLAFDPRRPDSGGIAFLSRFALRYGSIRQDQDDVRLPEVRAAFNSPFWPFVLATTSIGQEGVDFHWWCHALVHWNLPANPVDFEQREGRVNRFKGHAVRRNVAVTYREHALRAKGDPWRRLFEAAARDRAPGSSDLEPYWVFPGPATIERHILSYPMSRDVRRWEQLQDLLALYRLVFGQPRQEDMVAFLSRRGLKNDAERLNELRLDIRPPSRFWPSRAV